MIIHPFPPLFDKESKILILGSFPSVKSREQLFFYGHPQNRFWKVLGGVFGEETPKSIEEKKAFLHRNNIALWDVIASCEIEGSADSTIKNAKANNILPILQGSQVDRIFTNGMTAKKLYDRYILPQVKVEAAVLPSTSPANAAWNVERLIEAWGIIKNTDEL
ncbi:MAG: DNA-deoxyinosine glycosylase [Clostridia bacterium]|nr:DNA-deoxyinosine glycosylase [Clostridia bacterium]